MVVVAMVMKRIEQGVYKETATIVKKERCDELCLVLGESRLKNNLSQMK